MTVRLYTSERQYDICFIYSWILMIADLGTSISTTCALTGLPHFGLLQSGDKGVMSGFCCANGFCDNEDVG